VPRRRVFNTEEFILPDISITKKFFFIGVPASPAAAGFILRCAIARIAE